MYKCLQHRCTGFLSLGYGLLNCEAMDGSERSEPSMGAGRSSHCRAAQLRCLPNGLWAVIGEEDFSISPPSRLSQLVLTVGMDLHGQVLSTVVVVLVAGFFVVLWSTRKAPCWELSSKLVSTKSPKLST